LTIAKPQTLSVIDTLSAAYNALNKRVWVIVIPLIINLYLAFGTPISVGPLLQDFSTWFVSIQQQALEANPDAPSAPEVFEASLQQFALVGQADIRSLLSFVSYFPHLSIFRSIEAVNHIAISSVGQFFLLLVLINLGSFIASVLYLPQIATTVRENSSNSRFGFTLNDVWQVAWRIFVWVVMLFFAVFILFCFITLFMAIVALISPGLAQIAMLIFMLAAFWINLYISFAIEAMVLDRVNPFRAIQTSIQVVSRNLTSTLFLVILMMIIGQGLGLVWNQIASSSIGLIIACVGSAYIGTGLLIARMIFYRDRLRSSLQSVRAA
jgi:hypothetical protein